MQNGAPFMKKALKIIIPVLLVLILLFAAYWFFFRYRSDITANIFEHWGDRKADAGDYNGAVRYYGYAHDLDPNDTELSVKLASAYRETGNFTKAEYMIVHAIYADPENIDLYLTLSGIYVEQDKLMDAQLMLDHVSNETVRAQLETLRPAAPVISPDGGKYSDYISITATYDEGTTCYVTTDGEFPSLKQEPYSEPIALEGGETTVCAITVNENGLVSTAVYAGYTIAGVIEDAVFNDPALESYVQELLSKQGRTLQTDDLWGIKELELPETVTDLSDLHYFVGLEALTAHDIPSADYSFLAEMSHMKYLNLSGCGVSSSAMKYIGGCKELETLNLCNCGLSNVSALSTLTELKVLNLDDNSINDLAGLSTCSSLEELHICRNAVTSLVPLSSLGSLKILDVSLNSLETIAPITKCTSLSDLNVSDNKLTDLKDIGSLKNLTSLNASKNAIESVAGIENCKKLEVFDLSNNKLTDISGLANIKTLTDVNIDYNDVLKVPDFVDDCTLVNFSAAHNFLESCEGLRGLPNLNYVNMDYNNIRDISCLLSCNRIVQINVFGTYIKDVDEFRERGIIVNYDPT